MILQVRAHYPAVQRHPQFAAPHVPFIPQDYSSYAVWFKKESPPPRFPASQDLPQDSYAPVKQQ